jgi:hypothetical protein
MRKNKDLEKNCHSRKSQFDLGSGTAIGSVAHLTLGALDRGRLPQGKCREMP